MLKAAKASQSNSPIVHSQTLTLSQCELYTHTFTHLQYHLAICTCKIGHYALLLYYTIVKMYFSYYSLLFLLSVE